MKNGNSNEPKNPVSISMPLWLDDILTKESKQHFKSKSDIVCEALREYFLRKNDNLETWVKLYPDEKY